VYKGTVTDLRISAVDGTAFIDNLSGTLALANSPLLHTGALTQANTRISAAATFAFIDTNDATFATNLAAHLGKYLVIKDSAGKKAYAWIKAAGTGETLGDEKIDTWTNYGFDTFTVAGTDITEATQTDESSATIYKSDCAIVGGTLLKATIGGYTLNSGTAPIFVMANGVGLTGGSQLIAPVAVETKYNTASINYAFVGYRVAAKSSFAASGNSVKQVTAPSSSGATLSSTKNGTAMDNWESIETGFNYNDSSGYTYYIYGRDITDIADGNHQIEIYDSSNRMLKGVLKAAGTSETLGDELVTNGTFAADTDWNKDAGWTILDGTAIATNITGKKITQSYSYTQNILTKATLDVSVMGGGGYIYGLVGNAVSSSIVATGSHTKYVTVISGTAHGWAGTTTSATIDNYSLKQVLTPSSSGATIVSTKGGEVYNFSYKNPSFTYNSSSYYCIIKLLR